MFCCIIFSSINFYQISRLCSNINFTSYYLFFSFCWLLHDPSIGLLVLSYHPPILEYDLQCCTCINKGTTPQCMMLYLFHQQPLSWLWGFPENSVDTMMSSCIYYCLVWFNFHVDITWIYEFLPLSQYPCTLCTPHLALWWYHNVIFVCQM